MSLLRADHAFLNTPTVVTAVFVLLLVACPGKIAAHPPPQTQGEVVWQLDTHDGLPAPVQRAAFDPQRGTALLATLGGLYEVVDSTIRPIAERPAPEAKMTLAPGGGLYVWRTPSDGPEALWAADVFDIDGNLLGSLRPAEDPGGFGALLLGNMGRLIVTVLAIDDWRGTHGRFLYTFWSREGEILNRVERPSQESAVVAADGTSLLLLGEDSASAYASIHGRWFVTPPNLRRLSKRRRSRGRNDCSPQPPRQPRDWPCPRGHRWTPNRGSGNADACPSPPIGTRRVGRSDQRYRPVFLPRIRNR